MTKKILFTENTDGYHTFRIPAMITTQADTVLAFAEGRREGQGDAGDIDLVLKRSEDNGASWSDLQVVWNDPGNTCGNPCPVQDRESGTIFLLCTWNLGTDPEHAIITGTSRDKRRVFVIRSVDDGLTWSEPEEITSAVKPPEWTWYATGPGSALQIANGTYAGRIVVPCDYRLADDGKYYSHVFYSDDHGENWKQGGIAPQDQVNECMAAERGDGDLILNMRSFDREKWCRQSAISRDGGDTWIDPRDEPVLIDAICQGSIINYAQGDDEKGDWLLFSNAASRARENLTVRLSRDGGRSWPLKRTLHTGPSAYSSLCVLPDKRIACLHEGGEENPYERIFLTTLDMADIS